jgi:polysaccharide export outer membrane protein
MLLAAQLPLQALDVVYVAPSSLVGYNRVIGQILPTVQALYQLAIIRRDLLE